MLAEFSYGYEFHTFRFCRIASDGYPTLLICTRLILYLAV
jgi:hypothetical protein